MSSIIEYLRKMRPRFLLQLAGTIAACGLIVVLTGARSGSSFVESRVYEQKADTTDITNRFVDYADSVNRGLIKVDTMRASVPRFAVAELGKLQMHIVYSSPGVRGRVIWGGVVPYDEVWVTGAHQATRVDINQSITVNNKLLNEGQYAFFTVPGKDKWTVMFNRNYEQHLADEYDRKQDIVRMEVVPQTNNRFTPRLCYSVYQVSETRGLIVMEWEKMKISVPFFLN